MNRPLRPTPPTPPANRHTAAQKTPAQQHAKAPSAPPVYRPQPAPKVLQQKAVAKPFDARPPHVLRTTQPNAAPPNRLAPVSPFRQTQAPPKVLQGKPAGAPRSCNTPPIQAPPHTRTQPRVLQPKTAFAPQAPSAAGASHARPSSTPPVLQRHGSLPAAPGVVQLNRTKPKTKSRAEISRGFLNKPIKNVKKITARRDIDGRISNVRSSVRAGNKKKRKSTTGHKTTDTSGPLNSFLRDAKLLSRIIRMEGGHCIADVYGGSQCVSNTVPLPHTFNTIAYKKEETALKKTLSTTTDTTMEVSVEYPKNSLDGFLTEPEQKKLKRLVSATQYQKLEVLFSDVPDFMAWEVNSTGGHKWIEFRDIRKDIWPRGHKPKNVLTQDFVDAVNNL